MFKGDRANASATRWEMNNLIKIMNLALISPEITLFVGALIVLMLDVFCAKKFKDFLYISHLLSIIFCGLALFLTMKNFVVKELLFGQTFAVNSFTALTKSITIGLLTVIILISLNFVFSIKKISAEFLALLMISTVGAMILLSANDFLVFYLGLELQALPLYLLAALNRKSEKSSEAGIKYFVLGSVASGILLFGISMIYGFSGTVNFSALMELYHSSKSTEFNIPVGVVFGFVLVIVAMLFKISAAPFHMWAPDVYEGSMSIVTTFFATVVKFSSVAVLIHLFYTLLISWPGIDKIFITSAILSLAVGSFGAMFQKNFKRLLAYSSIGHVGFILLGIAAFNKEGYVASMVYIIIYSVISLGNFGFLTLIKKAGEENYEIESDEENDKIFNISSLAGLSKTNPVIAFSLAILMFSSAGIPPLAGFFSKFYIILAIILHNSTIVAVLAVLFSVVSAYYYLRIVKIMYFDEPKKDAIRLDDMINGKFLVILTAVFNLLAILFISQIFNLVGNFIL